MKISNKNIINHNDYWSFEASHNGYYKKFGVIHHRKIEFLHKTAKLIGLDRIEKKSNFGISNFEIRFHLNPSAKVMKTQDGKAIYIGINGEGWKFMSFNNKISFETGLFFGNKDNFLENQNILITGKIIDQNVSINWEIEKVQ